MADDKDGDDGGKEGGKGGLMGKLKFVIVGVVALGAGYFLFGGGGGESSAGPTTTIALEDLNDGAILAVGTLTVNLTDEQPHFGRVAFSVVLVEGTDPLPIEPQLPLLLDAALKRLSSYTADELRTTQGQERLRNELSSDAIELLNDETDRVVKRVVLTDLLVQ
ncbi:MAG: flagellar basal body-associated FliL family protein [Actinomycetia bacterium]|nr:flagellar basal body-associated FliL family protein [Actinomycetes bacterium]MCP4960848.1 flagellar basal body-associated FliL family protein [Actinomycetes bacterium]